MYGQFSSIQYLYFYSDFRRNYLRKCMQMSVYYNTEKITNHSKNINFWKCQRLCEHSYELSQQRSNSVNKRTGFTHRVIVNSMEKGITKKTPCITKCCTELLGINTHVCSRFTTGYYCYFNKFIKCVEITDQKVDASSVQSVMDIYNFKQFKCSCFCFQSHYYTRISQGVIFALCWKLCINIWTQNCISYIKKHELKFTQCIDEIQVFQQQHQQSFIQDEESLTNILKEFAVCIGYQASQKTVDLKQEQECISSLLKLIYNYPLNFQGLPAYQSLYSYYCIYFSTNRRFKQKDPTIYQEHIQGLLEKNRANIHTKQQIHPKFKIGEKQYHIFHHNLIKNKLGSVGYQGRHIVMENKYIYHIQTLAVRNCQPICRVLDCRLKNAIFGHHIHKFTHKQPQLSLRFRIIKQLNQPKMKRKKLSKTFSLNRTVSKILEWILSFKFTQMVISSQIAKVFVLSQAQLYLFDLCKLIWHILAQLSQQQLLRSEDLTTNTMFTNSRIFTSDIVISFGRTQSVLRQQISLGYAHSLAVLRQINPCKFARNTLIIFTKILNQYILFKTICQISRIYNFTSIGIGCFVACTINSINQRTIFSLVQIRGIRITTTLINTKVTTFSNFKTTAAKQICQNLIFMGEREHYGFDYSQESDYICERCLRTNLCCLICRFISQQSINKGANHFVVIHTLSYQCLSICNVIIFRWFTRRFFKVTIFIHISILIQIKEEQTIMLLCNLGTFFLEFDQDQQNIYILQCLISKPNYSLQSRCIYCQKQSISNMKVIALLLVDVKQYAFLISFHIQSLTIQNYLSIMLNIVIYQHSNLHYKLQIASTSPSSQQFKFIGSYLQLTVVIIQHPIELLPALLTDWHFRLFNSQMLHRDYLHQNLNNQYPEDQVCIYWSKQGRQAYGLLMHVVIKCDTQIHPNNIIKQETNQSSNMTFYSSMFSFGLSKSGCLSYTLSSFCIFYAQYLMSKLIQ
ncbi:unnamed protein product [Paramecium octaurelia]|uniref:Uncharacterized protein n=1 Tax=Paramecium octaurelia TaxID=43137 RepID=A0A8S1WBZ2_PAROT|nr:unnamed protein product [Paramecium octaurelia]